MAVSHTLEPGLDTLRAITTPEGVELNLRLALSVVTLSGSMGIITLRRETVEGFPLFVERRGPSRRRAVL